MVQQMFNGIDNCSVVIVFVTKNYMEKVAGRGKAGEGDNCMKEYNYADMRKTSSRMLAMVNEKSCCNPRYVD